MKKNVFLFIFLAITGTQAMATIRTLCNTPFSPGQFTTFLAAHTACNNNDTIYVHGSAVTYGAITISKVGIVVIGTGHNPVKQGPLVSAFTSITITALSCQVIGVTFDNMTCINNSVSVKRCKILQTAAPFGIATTTSQSMTIEGCVFSGNTNNLQLSPNSSNTTISNNIFNGVLAISGSTTSTLSTFIIANNLFLGLSGGVFASLGNATINNNIFYRASPQGVNVATTTMNNNISFGCPNNSFPAPGANNLVAVNPLFTSFPVVGALFDYTHNYILAAGSPGLLNGSDGTDRGVFGGFGTKFNMTGEPAIAEITSFVITSPTIIAPGGTLNINVNSKRVR